ncbi:hypothetical protein G9A89_020102 [Geosiphon pyriformis]|nr:hypothetical protein G9A89_020102 [Geosiphon pyriformis]
MIRGVCGVLELNVCNPQCVCAWMHNVPFSDLGYPIFAKEFHRIIKHIVKGDCFVFVSEPTKEEEEENVKLLAEQHLERKEKLIPITSLGKETPLRPN